MTRLVAAFTLLASLACTGLRSESPTPEPTVAITWPQKATVQGTSPIRLDDLGLTVTILEGEEGHAVTAEGRGGRTGTAKVRFAWDGEAPEDVDVTLGDNFVHHGHLVRIEGSWRGGRLLIGPDEGTLWPDTGE